VVRSNARSTRPAQRRGNPALTTASPPPHSHSSFPRPETGKGTLTYSNGDKYEGEWLDNKRHGFGTYWVHALGRGSQSFT
jgi:hypothetical protein